MFCSPMFYSIGANSCDKNEAIDQYISGTNPCFILCHFKNRLNRLELFDRK